MEFAASIIAVVDYSFKLSLNIAQFVHEAKDASGATKDLFFKVTSLHQTCHTVHLSLKKRAEQVNKKLLSLDEQEIWCTIRNALERCEKTVERFKEELEGLSTSEELTWRQQGQQQLKLKIRSPKIASLEKKIDANIGSLQVLLPCLQP